MYGITLKSILAVAAVFGATAASAAEPFAITLVDVQSIGNLNVAGNVIQQYNLGNTEVTSIGFDVDLTALSPSWISEMWLKVSNTSGTGGVVLRPAPNDHDFQFSGTASFAFTVNLSALGLAFMPDSDGLVHLQFYENFADDLPGADGLWNGDIVLNAPIPEPGTALLAALGVAALLGRVRRNDQRYPG